MAKTKVRIAVSVDPKGEWHASGWTGASDHDAKSCTLDAVDEGEQTYFVEAELDIPETIVVAGTVAATAS